MLLMSITAMAQNAPKIVVTEGLIGYYPFKGNAADMSNNKNNGNDYGPALIPDRFGEDKSAFKFDGVDDYIDLGHLPQLKDQMSMSISLWIKMEKKPSTQQRGIVGKWRSEAEPPNIFEFDNGEGAYLNNGGFRIGLLDMSVVKIGGKTPINTGEWIHIACVWDSKDGFIAIYKNGKLENSKIDEKSIGKALKYHTNYTARMGQAEGGSWNGILDDVRVYNRKLTEEDIMTIFGSERVVEKVNLNGVITNIKTNQPIVAELEIKAENNEVPPVSIKTKADGKYTLDLPLYYKYKVEIKGEKFIPTYGSFDPTAMKKNTASSKNFALKQMFIGEAVRINNIFFETGKATLKPISFPELDKLMEIFADYKELGVLISGHTDNVGNEEANTKLSLERAESVKLYLKSKGVTNEIVTVGYGSTKPVAANDTEAGKEQNRRVEFTILEKK